MKTGFIISLLLSCQFVFAQTKGVNPIAKKTISASGVTRAIIVGISDYQSPDIPDLLFAHKDAEIFSDYLRSSVGGKVKSENIILLTNEKATAGQFISALSKLNEVSEEGDLAIIYFSGHGDVEINSIDQPGFLLFWDAPQNVYMGGGTLSINYLQDVIYDLSTEKKSQVIIISDACHAGKLAGSKIGGPRATTANLTTQFANEIKILSCQPNELAIEGRSWGNGRGVFSYCFVNGLEGTADLDANGAVSLGELDRYLSVAVPKAAAPHMQTPLFLGNKNAVVARINFNELLSDSKDHDFREVQLVLDEKFLTMSYDEVSDSNLVAKIKKFNDAIHSGNLLGDDEESAWNLYYELTGEPELDLYIGMMQRNLAAALQDEAQQAINDYLSADPDEMQSRWDKDSKYQKFPEYLSSASELLGEEHFFHNSLKAKSYYFKGLNLRLSAEDWSTGSFLIPPNKSRIKQAIVAQKKCINLEPQAAFAMNELGYLNFLLDNFEEAIKYYQAALKIAPEWTMPWMNLCGSYNQLGNTTKGKKMGEKAISLKKDFALSIYNLSHSYQLSGEIHKAKELLRYNLEVNPDFSSSYFRLAHIYFKEENYEESIKNYKQYFSLKPNDLLAYINQAHNYLQVGNNEMAKTCFLKAKEINPEHESAIQGMIEYYFYTGDLEMAKSELKIYVKNYPEDGFAYYLIASISIQLEDKEACLENIELAFKNGFKDHSLIENDKVFEAMIKSPAYLKIKEQFQF